ncbi:MAG: hypothetical protein ABIR56_15570, partial [Polaromonas sp.]
EDRSSCDAASLPASYNERRAVEFARKRKAGRIPAKPGCNLKKALIWHKNFFAPGKFAKAPKVRGTARGSEGRGSKEISSCRQLDEYQKIRSKTAAG